MTTPAHDASLVGQQKLEEQDLVRFKVSMDALKRRLSDPQAKDKQLRKACRNFEAVFIGKLWEQMRATVPKEGYLHSPQEDAYLSMFDQAFSEKMADSGGMGLADMLYGHLKERLADMGRNALPGRLEVPAAPEQAPAEGEAAPAAPAQVSETPAIKPLAESGRDPRQAQERQR
ncbi:MAG TPA: peptidase M24, partial [Desulfovibrio sp.]|nr:peptidase M24 [Desulfovibrio sp.]